MSPADLTPEGRARFNRLSARWAAEATPPPRTTLLARLTALLTSRPTIATAFTWST